MASTAAAKIWTAAKLFIRLWQINQKVIRTGSCPRTSNPISRRIALFYLFPLSTSLSLSLSLAVSLCNSPAVNCLLSGYGALAVAKRKKEKRKVCAENENVGQVLWPRKLKVGHKTLATSLTPAPRATSPAAASLALVSRVDKWAARAAGAIKKIAENYSCHAVKQKCPTEKCNKLWQSEAKQKASSRSPHSLETWSFCLPWIMASSLFFYLHP